MTRFILRTLLIYTILSVVITGSIIFFSKRESRERRYPRKTLYVVNMTNDTISVYLTGTYTRAEKRALDDKPDQYTFRENIETLPYEDAYGAVIQSIAMHIPYKRDHDILFPQDFTIHIEKQDESSISLSREQFFRLTKGKSSDNTWVLYVDSLMLSNL